MEAEPVRDQRALKQIPITHELWQLHRYFHCAKPPDVTALPVRALDLSTITPTGDLSVLSHRTRGVARPGL